jgi:hypothetical protein
MTTVLSAAERLAIAQVLDELGRDVQRLLDATQVRISRVAAVIEEPRA